MSYEGRHPWGSVNAKDFFVKGDGVADDTAKIQAAIDYAIANGISEVRLPSGTYKTTDTIYLGLGDTFRTISLIGDKAPPYRGATAGTKIVPTAIDRPAINVQGSRNCRISGISIKGLNYSHIETNVTAPWNTPNTADWRAQGIPNGLDRFRPYAAVTIDAYSGVAPASPYPGTYGRVGGSNVTIEHCDFAGFAVAIASKPSDDDSNADFLKVRNCQIEFCIYGIAACNTQSRNVEIRNIEYYGVHTLLTNYYFGKRNGKFGGPISNVSGGYSYQLIDIPGSTIFGTVGFEYIYFEQQSRIGIFGAAASFNYPLGFRDSHFNISEDVTNYSPPALLTIPGGIVRVAFERCSFEGHRRMVNLVKGGEPILSVRNCNFLGASEYIASGATAVQGRGISFFGGVQPGHCNPDAGTLEVFGNQGRSYDEGTTTHRERSFSQVIDHTTSRGLCHLGATRFRDAFGRSYTIKDRRPPVALAPTDTTNTFTVAIAVSGETVTFRYHKTKQENNAQAYKIEPGDTLYFTDYGTICIVTAVAVNADTHYDVTAKIQNNFTFDGVSTYTSGSALGSATGTIWLYHTDTFVGKNVYYGDLTSGSANVANVHLGNNDGTAISTHLAVDDFLYFPQMNDSYLGLPYPINTQIATITNGSPGSLTLTKNATATGRYPLLAVGI